MWFVINFFNLSILWTSVTQSRAWNWRGWQSLTLSWKSSTIHLSNLKAKWLITTRGEFTSRHRGSCLLVNLTGTHLNSIFWFEAPVQISEASGRLCAGVHVLLIFSWADILLINLSSFKVSLHNIMFKCNVLFLLPMSHQVYN